MEDRIIFVGLRFRVVDEELLWASYDEIVEGYGEDILGDGPHTLEEIVEEIVVNLDVLADQREQPLGWLDVGLERVQ